eukprot:scaffold660446_cov41-Prasinocladus_malaysianus.AAC.1
MTVSSKRPLSARGSNSTKSASSAMTCQAASTRPASAARARTGTFIDRCDEKELSPQMELAREAAEQRRLEEKKAAARALAEQNRAYR